MILVLWQETHLTLHSLVDRNKVTGLKSKSDIGVTEALVVVMWEIQCTERSIILYVWCVKSHWIMWKKWCHQLTNVIQELFRRWTSGFAACFERSDITAIRGHTTFLVTLDEIFLPGPRLQTDGVLKVHWRPAGGENKDHSKTYDFQSHS